MRKIFTLSLLFMLCALGANAKSAGRSWDFTKWSDATLAILDAEWQAAGQKRDYTGWNALEKANETSGNDTGVWYLNNNVAGAFKFNNGEEIPELRGLLYNSGKPTANSGARSVGIAYNLPSTSIGEYAGPKYIWFLGKKDQYPISIPGCQPGDKIEIDVESHKTTDGRGVTLSVNGTVIAIEEGNEKPTTLTHCVWTLPDDVTVDENGECQVDIKLTNGGCHIYNIIINDGGGEVVKDPANVAFIYDSSVEGYDLDSDYLYIAAAGGNANVTAIDVKDASYDSLLEYEVVVVSNAINPANASVIKTAIAFVPMLVNGTALYTAWGFGTPVAADGNAVTITDEDNALFTNLDTEEPLDIAATISTVELGAYFAKDKVLAKVGDAVAIHQHNAGRNSYLMLPYEAAYMDGVNLDNMMTLVANAIDVLRDTKTAVKATTKPSIITTQKDGATTVEIKAAADAVIYYTVDGTEPTEASPVYTEAFDVTENTTIKAFATADGYLASEVATAEALIASMTAAPSIAVQQVDGKAVVTITAEEGATVYYNYSGSDAIASSAIYTEPIAVERTAAITAFAAAENQLNSPAVTENIVVDGYKFYTELSHFDASTAQTGTSSNSTYYYSWGKNGQSYWSDEVDTETHVTGSEGQDSIIYTYKPANILETVYVEGCDWRMASEGQVMVWQNTNPTNNVGNDGGYNPETVEDWGASKFDVQFAKVPTGSPNTANIMSVKKFQAPFEVVLYMGNASGGSPCQADILVATDTLGTWTNIATIDGSATKRLLKKGVATYNGTDEVYVKVASAQGSSKVAMIFDIIVNGVGEYNAIESVNNDAAPARKSNAIFNLAGQKVSADYRGIVIMNGKKVMVK